MSSLCLCSVIEDEDIVFLVDVPPQAYVCTLKKEIQRERGQSTLQGVDPHTLELWKPRNINTIVVKPANTLLARIRLMGALSEFAEKLEPPDSLSEIFPTQPSMDHIHIIVKIKAYPTKKHLREEDDEPEGVKQLRFETGKGSPSALALPDEFQKITGPGHAICCNRPFEIATIPLVLLHESFGIFKDQCLQSPSKAAIACLIVFHPEKIPDTEYITNGNLTVVIMPPSVRECKNEHGNPLNQAVLYYSNFLKYALNRPEHFYNFDTRFPCVLLVDMGSYFAFYGALWDGARVRVESLTPGFDLATHWRESKARDVIASSFDALLLVIENIQSHYDKIEAEARVNPAPKPYNRDLQKARRFPFVTSYVDGGQATSFTYVEQLDEEHLLFSAFVNDDRQANCIYAAVFGGCTLLPCILQLGSGPLALHSNLRRMDGCCYGQVKV